MQPEIPDADFSVVEFKYSGDRPEYLVRNAMTANAATVQGSINALGASGGGDFPEASTSSFNEAYNPVTGATSAGRANTRKFVVVIGAAPPHHAVPDGFSSCFDSSADAHGLNAATELASLAGAQRTLFMVAVNSTIKPCYDQLVAGGFGGSASVLLGASFADQIVALIKAASAEVADVHLMVSSATPPPAHASWVSFTPSAVGPVTPPTDLGFLANIAVPTGTLPGTYTFDIVTLADGGDIGHQTLTIVVPVSDHDPDCSTVAPGVQLLRPPNHKYRLVPLGGATDVDGDPVTLSVTQDEPLNGPGDGDASPDAKAGTSSRSVFVRAERSGTGDGRVYRVAFRGSGGKGGTCGGTVMVAVPHDQGSGSVAVDSGLNVDSFCP